MKFIILAHALLSLSYQIVRVSCFDINSKSNVAVYWGQNSGGSQESLATYCASDSVDIVILSFMSAFPSIELNFAGQCTDTFSDGLLHCSQIGKDISTCQSQGKKVLLSLGGATGNYGFSSDSEAETFATTLWNKFGGGSDNERPFDSAVLDGFDFDIENKDQTGYVAVSKKLREYFDNDSSKTYYLSAAPQCPYPDASVGDLLSETQIDFAFIQFYNNYCSLGSNFNWDTWTKYASNAPNPNIKLYLGLPSSSSSAGSGFVSSNTISTYVNEIQCDSNFGGISLWDASSAWANTDGSANFASQMKNILEQGTCDSSSEGSSSSINTQSTYTVATGTIGNINSYTFVSPTKSVIDNSPQSTLSIQNIINTNAEVQSTQSAVNTYVQSQAAQNTINTNAEAQFIQPTANTYVQSQATQNTINTNEQTQNTIINTVTTQAPAAIRTYAYTTFVTRYITVY